MCSLCFCLLSFNSMFVRSIQILLCPCRLDCSRSLLNHVLLCDYTASYLPIHWWWTFELLVMGVWVVSSFWTIMERADILEHVCIYYIVLCTKPQKQTDNAVLFHMVLWVGLAVPLEVISGLTMPPVFSQTRRFKMASLPTPCGSWCWLPAEASHISFTWLSFSSRLDWLSHMEVSGQGSKRVKGKAVGHLEVSAMELAHCHVYCVANPYSRG